MRLSSRHALMLTQFLVIFPHFAHLPFWLTGLSVVVIFSQLTPHPRIFGPRQVGQKVIQSTVFLGGVLGIFQSYQTLLGIEAGTAFLVVCLLGKLFEVNAWRDSFRDSYVVLTFGLFITAAQFLFDQDLITALWATVSTLAILLAMAKQNTSSQTTADSSAMVTEQNSANSRNRSSTRTLMLIVIQAIPLMYILFIFFPRMPPLWTINLNSAQAKTGISDAMSPGDIANLSQSTELAFRVIFQDSQIPKRSDLYWRGLVLGTFDGRTWRPTNDIRLKQIAFGARPAPPWLINHIDFKDTRPKQYQLIVEPTQQSWLFALDLPFSLDAQAGLTREYNMQAADDIVTQTTFNLYQLDVTSKDAALPDWLATNTLQLPLGINPKTRAFAAELFAKVQRNPEKYANAVMAWYRLQNYRYTLQPPKLEGDRIDQFLFETRQGFCEHYASSFTFLMRAAGVPARVVVGYQGGQIGRDGRSLEIRQMDAHAWSEVWLAGRGWVRFDPTAMIAPERVIRGMDALTDQNPSMFGDGLAATLRYNQFQILGNARSWMDYARYMWQQKVVGFDQQNQENFLYKLFGFRSQMMQILIMFAALVGVMLAIVGVMWWRRRVVWHPLDAPLIRLSKRLEKQGLARQPEEGVIDWLRRVSRISGYRAQAEQLIAIYSQARYAEQSEDTRDAQRALWGIVSRWGIRTE
jgi:protein-glutamine gamma-glutamyltransferase